MVECRRFCSPNSLCIQKDIYRSVLTRQATGPRPHTMAHQNQQPGRPYPSPTWAGQFGQPSFMSSLSWITSWSAPDGPTLLNPQPQGIDGNRILNAYFITTQTDGNKLVHPTLTLPTNWAILLRASSNILILLKDAGRDASCHTGTWSNFRFSINSRGYQGEGLIPHLGRGPHAQDFSTQDVFGPEPVSLTSLRPARHHLLIVAGSPGKRPG